MKGSNTALYILIVIGIYSAPLSPNAGLNHTPVAYSQSQASSFLTEVNAIDNMPAKNQSGRNEV
jgi:hypothetical protein